MHSPAMTDRRCARIPAVLRQTAAAAAWLSLALAATIAPARAASAQQPQPKLTIAQIEASAYPQIRAVVTVLDANGIPVRGLGPAQFQASDGASAVPIN